jgi:malate synthase
MTLHLPPVTESPPAPVDAVSPVHVLRPIGPAERRVLTGEALHFIGRLARRFEPQRQFILEQRAQRQMDLEAGAMPDFPVETRELRASVWRVAPIPPDLRVRRVEITGPVERKMVINALNSGADVFMADFEDSNAPTWENCIEGQVNLQDAVRRTISYVSPDGKQYRLNDRTATLMVRPRGWHLDEKHVLVEGRPISASLFDFGLYLFHNAEALRVAGTGPYFYLPKLESHLEARLWNDVFVWSQRELGISQETIRATVLIETILAAFEMDEILWELRDHSAGLNCGRWDYIFSLVKKFSTRPDFVLSDRALVTMTASFMRSYSLLAIKTCHRRGIHAIGGMAAQIPIKNDPVASEAAIAKVRADKLREVTDGHDGTWVAHPGLVSVAMEEFAKMPGTDQLARQREDVSVGAADLLTVPRPPHISEDGVRTNIRVGIQYLESWLRGSGCVPINNLMEDAATAEISRAQLWQWVRHKATLVDGRTVTLDLVETLMADELSKLRDQLGPSRFASGKFARAAELFQRMTESARFTEFLTSVAYRDL